MHSTLEIAVFKRADAAELRMADAHKLLPATAV